MVESGAKYILIPSKVMPMIAEVDRYAGTTKGKGFTFTWSPDKSRAWRRAALSGTALPVARGGFLLSREEYPYNSFAQGGAGAHVGIVPLHENWIQGGFIRAASMLQGFKPGDTINVVIFDGQ